MSIEEKLQKEFTTEELMYLLVYYRSAVELIEAELRRRALVGASYTVH